MSERMNPVAKKIWLDALRSEKYKQATGVLKAEVSVDGSVGYCCLGVLSEEAPTTCGRFMDVGLGNHQFETPNGYVEAAVLPGPVMIWADIESATGTIVLCVYKDKYDVECTLRESLTELNDNYGFTFEQIADVIEYAL